MFRKELIIIEVKNGENHHEICKFIRSQSENITSYDVLILPESAHVYKTSAPEGYIDITNISSGS